MVQKHTDDNEAFPASMHDHVLAEIDERHQVYMCEYNLIHLVWGEDMLPFCPGDFMGLPYQLSALVGECDMQCQHGEACEHVDDNSGMVHLEYGSLRLPLTVEECRRLRTMVETGAKQLHALYTTGYFEALRRQSAGLSRNGCKSPESC